ncbi:16770_t:CDS:2, partial [Dentiscutata heterogama]
MPSSSSSSKFTESLSIQPSGSYDVLTNQVKPSISPLDNNSNSLNNNIENGESLYTSVKSITSNDKEISPLIIPKEPLPSSNVFLEILKPKLNRVPTGRRPIKYQNPTEEIPETPTLLQKEKFRTSEIKNVDSEKFKQKEFDDKSLNNSGSKSNLREKDNVPIERIRKDSKASEYTSDDSKDIRSPYVRDGDKSSDYREFATRPNRIRENEDDDNKPLRGRARSKTNDFEERGRAKSRARETDFEERGRAKSRSRETDERDAKSRTREVDERGRAKSKTREIDERGRAKSRTREPDERSRAVSRSR